MYINNYYTVGELVLSTPILKKKFIFITFLIYYRGFARNTYKKKSILDTIS